MFGRGQQELHNELVDIFMETWRNKNLSYIETISSDIEVDAFHQIPLRNLMK
jgi:hypothetical protein